MLLTSPHDMDSAPTAALLYCTVTTQHHRSSPGLMLDSSLALGSSGTAFFAGDTAAMRTTALEPYGLERGPKAIPLTKLLLGGVGAGRGGGGATLTAVMTVTGSEGSEG